MQNILNVSMVLHYRFNSAGNTQDFYIVPDVPNITLKFQQLTRDSGIYQCSLTSFLLKHFLISKKVMQAHAFDVSIQLTLRSGRAEIIS